MNKELPFYHIDGAALGRDASLAAFADAVKYVFAVRFAEASGATPVTAWAAHLGTIMAGTFSGPELMFDRSARLVAEGGLDHILVQYYARGGFVGRTGDDAIEVAPGDVCVFDLTSILHTRSSAFTNYSLLIPRDAFLAEIDEAAALHGLVLPAGDALTAILSDHLVSLIQRIPPMTAREAHLAAHATASLTATILVGEARRRGGVRSSPAVVSPIRRAHALIDRYIHDPALDADRIADELGLSRAALYRLFAPAGGVARHILQRRLNGAVLDLANPARRERIGDVAARWGFSSDAGFSRAFRRRFGVSPIAARDGLARPSIAHDLETGEMMSEDRRFAQWTRDLQTTQP